MSSLQNLQNQLQDFILTGQPGINDSIVETATVSVGTRLAIYSDAYKLRLIESLTATFPALHAYLGTEEFENLCSSYIASNPSLYRSIRWYGSDLAVFITTYYTEDYSFLTELAEFEWKMTLAFDAADVPIIKVEDMAHVPGEAWTNMRFVFHASLQRVSHFWNTIPLWQTLVHDEDIPELNKSPTATAWVLWRAPDYLIQFYSMSEEEAWVLDALIQGATFGELCEGLCQWIAVEDVGMSAAGYLKNWIQQGLVAELLMG